MPSVNDEAKVVANALSLAGHESANDVAFVNQLTTVLKSTKGLYDKHKGSDWVKSSTFIFQHVSRTARFAKLGADAMSPARATAAILAVMSEKVAFTAGFSADDERVNCGAALTALAGNTAAMLILGAGTGGLAIGLTVVSLASSLMAVNRECKFLDKDTADQSIAEPGLSLKLH
jgi:hypothetical protein